uniref:AT-rich interactive domain-containing protein 1-like n=1 Tax=Tanacetum cinerariifolium TaxID=118510 RepID=A0A6L2L080_TANCI|nr:AT-rich interactive domain-containing protein 1-like [Tanacetum cinerariifolium]
MKPVPQELLQVVVLGAKKPWGIQLLRLDDAEMFDVSDLQGKHVIVVREVADKEVNAAGEVNATSITTTDSAAAIITAEEITLAQALMEIKTTKPKTKRIVLQEPSESPTTTTKIYSKKSHDKGKGITVKETVNLKKKDQIRPDEETALRLQAEFDKEEQRLTKETVKQRSHIERERIGKGRQSSCGCKFKGSLECVRFHISEKRYRVRLELGPAFANWKFDTMGEEVSLYWTMHEEKKFAKLIKLNPESSSKRFWAYQNRTDPSNVDSDDDELEKVKGSILCSPKHNGQGERECIDELSWLKYVTYEEGRNHSTQPEDPNVSVAQKASNLIPEVSNTHSSHISEPVETTNNTSSQGESVQKQEIFATQKDTPVEQNEYMEEQENFSTQEDTSKRYALPPRANRGVPSKRYSPEKRSRGSRYLIANIAKGNLSKEAKAFTLSMYSDEIPTNTEQALKFKHWKDAMEEEIKTLIKNNTWEKRVLPPGKKTVGCRWVFTIKYKPDRNDKEEITKLKKNFFIKFEMKDLGRLKYFLGIEVLRSKQGIFMYQKKDVLDLLAEIGMVYCKPADTPMIVNQKLYIEKSLLG